jgi:hypothetical protein
MKLKQILLENLYFWRVDILVKTDTTKNKVEIFNEIRALPGIVVLTVRQSDFLDSKSTKDYEYSLVSIKFLSSTNPKKEIDRIKQDAKSGNKKIDGLIQIVPKLDSLTQLGKY